MTGSVSWMRHGTCEDGHRCPHAHARPDSPLSDQGRSEATKAARRLLASGTAPSIIASSPLPRARETAAVLATLLDRPLADPIAVFSEWRAPDCVIGLGPSDYPPAYRAWRATRARRPDTALAGGESLTAFVRRARTAAQHARALAEANGDIVVVSHRVLIGGIAALYGGQQQPGAVFASATSFALAPAQIWQPTMEGRR